VECEHGDSDAVVAYWYSYLMSGRSIVQALLHPIEDADNILIIIPSTDIGLGDFCVIKLISLIARQEASSPSARAICLADDWRRDRVVNKSYLGVPNLVLGMVDHESLMSYVTI